MGFLKRVTAILDNETINQGLTVLQQNSEFQNLKQTYDKLRETLKQSGDYTDEEASSLINYAIHKEVK